LELHQLHYIMNHWRGVFKILEQDWQSAANQIGLTMAEQHVLWILHFEKEATMTEIADIGLWDVSTVMQVVKRLKEKEFVLSRKMQHDRRISYVSLTKAGEEKVAESLQFKYRFFDYVDELESSSEDGRKFVEALLFRQKEMNSYFHGEKFVEWVDKSTNQLKLEILSRNSSEVNFNKK
jgi:MarR family protease production transcriptional regulator HPr